MNISGMKEHVNSVLPPVQPWLKSNSIDYVEKICQWNPISIKSGALFYQFKTGSQENCHIQLLPDVCINVLHNCNPIKPKANLYGIINSPYFITLMPNTTYFGVRPYSLFGTKGLDASTNEMYGQKEMELTDVIKTHDLEEAIAGATSFNERIDLVQKYYLTYWKDDQYTFSLEEYSAIHLCLSKGNISIEDIAMQTGYSERYCRKKFNAYYHISPKKYGRLIRFQASLQMLLGKKSHLSHSQIAQENGYFDESHFINEFKSFTSICPEKFRNSLFASDYHYA